MAFGAYAGGSANPGGGMDAVEDPMTDGPMNDNAPPPEETPDSDTGLLPKALLEGKDYKVGDTIPLKITRIGEKDFEVQCEYPEEKEEHTPEGEDVDQGAVPVDRKNTDMGAGLGSYME